jgi:hypothetical protein
MSFEADMSLAGLRLCQMGCRLRDSSLRAVVGRGPAGVGFVGEVVGHSSTVDGHSAPLRDVYSCLSIGEAFVMRQ